MAKTFAAFAKTLELDSGSPLIVEDFQAAFVEDVDAGNPEVWLIIPEGNGKTTLLAAFVLWHLQTTPYASVPVAAATRDQAMLLYRQAKGFVLRNDLPGFLCQDGTRRILYSDKVKGMRTGHLATSMAQIFAADVAGGDGIIPTLAIIDEPHRQKHMGLYLTWSGKLGKRSGQLVIISTSGEPNSEFEAMRAQIRQDAAEVEREGCFSRYANNGVVLHEWAVPETADVEDLELVKAANPLSTITIETLTKKRHSPTMTLDHWKRFTCNMPTRSVEAAITEIEWANASGEGIPEGETIWLGVDPALKHDSFALVPYWEASPEDRRFGPATIIEPPGHDMIPTWQIEQALHDIHMRNTIHTVVLDALEAPGADIVREFCETELGISVLERGTGLVAQATDYVRFMEALRRGWLTHSGDPGLTRHALNAIARRLPRGDYVFERPVASRSAKDQNRRRIDALDAAAMVHSIASAQHSVYDDRGLIAI
jgi:phage terminase large subunit-like protein